MLRFNNGETDKCFTLVELMLVMGVIVILVAMLFTVVIGAKNKARKNQALTGAHTLVLALKNYRMEFGKWPNQTQGLEDKTYFTNNHLVVMPLIGYNPRGRVFLTVQLLSITTNDAGAIIYRGQTDLSTNFLDPWGVPYVICMDENMNGACEISISNVPYYNIRTVPPVTNYYTAGPNTNAAYSVTNMEVAVASFAGEISRIPLTAPFEVETWSEPQ